jgi:hypothetical protein
LLAVTTCLPALSAAFTQAMAGPFLAADQFDQHVDVGFRGHFHGIVEPLDAGQIDAAVAARGRGADGGDDDRPAALRGQFVGLGGEDSDHDDAPTVPRPATRRRATLHSCSGMPPVRNRRAQRRAPSATTLSGFACVLGEEPLDVARRLADAVLVLDQRDAHEIVAVLAEADARRDRDIGLLDQQLGEFERAELAEGSGIGAQANIVAAGAGTPSRPAKASTMTSRRR